MYRRLVTLSRMLHDGVGHGTPFVLSTPLARPLACPSMALWDAGRCTVGGDGPRSNGLKESCQRGVRRAGHVRRQIHCIYLSWPAVAGVKRPIGRQQVAQARRVERIWEGVLERARTGRLKVQPEELYEELEGLTRYER